MKKSTYAVSGIIRADEVLRFLLKRGQATFTEIYKGLGRPRSSTYKTLNTLESLGYIRCVGSGRNYCLGMKLLELGGKASTRFDCLAEARPLAKQLSIDTKRACHVGILDHTDVIYVLKEDANSLFQIDTWVGKRIGAYCTALGKVLLAWKDEAELDVIINSITFEKVAPNTITNPKIFLDMLKDVRERGWAIDDEESSKMVRCVAAPIRDNRGRVCSAISISTLTDLDSYDELVAITTNVVQSARLISQNLGGC